MCTSITYVYMYACISIERERDLVTFLDSDFHSCKKVLGVAVSFKFLGTVSFNCSRHQVFRNTSVQGALCASRVAVGGFDALLSCIFTVRCYPFSPINEN